MHTLAHMEPPRTERDLAAVIRDAGIVGAGGAGFPTYVKYQKPTPILLVNGAESEPGYYTDKLLFHERAQEFADLFAYLDDVEGYERIIVGAEERAKPYLRRLEALAASTGGFEVRYFENVYRYGQERALIKRLLGIPMTKDQIPPDVGVTVNNNETLWNVFRAVFEGHPVTTKFVVVYGETPVHLAVEAPVGALAEDLLRLAGIERPDASMTLYDGGPVLCDEVADWTRVPYGIQRTTNGLLLVHPERRKSRAKSYPRPDGPEPPTRIRNVEQRIRRVRIALGGRYGAPALATVSPGDDVEVGQRIGDAVPGKLSVPVHASIRGRVTQVDATHVAIEAHPER